MSDRLTEISRILERQEVEVHWKTRVPRILGIDTTARAIMALDGAAARDVIAERRRQIEAEGWTSWHDDQHHRGEMAMAAACYAHPERVFIARQLAGRGYETYTNYRDAWPWADEWWKPKSRRHDLIRAAALILAEIERLDRIAPPAPEPQP